MDKKVIIFGPWVGEFSYELSWWNPECRKIRNDHFKDCYAVHLGFGGRGGFTEMAIHKPKDMAITRERCLEDHPYGEYVHYDVNSDIERDVMSKINNYFNNDSPTIFLMARTRTRHGNRCYLDWNPDNWPIFTKRLIEELGVNIISLSIKTQGSRGGSKGLAGHELFTDLQHKIMNFELDKGDLDSFEKQLAILKNTKCSIYGASGAAVVPFFVNTPSFTQQTKEEGFRLELGWEKDLMDFKHFKNFDKYHNNDIYDSSVDELFQEFLSFYKEL